MSPLIVSWSKDIYGKFSKIGELKYACPTWDACIIVVLILSVIGCRLSLVYLWFTFALNGVKQGSTSRLLLSWRRKDYSPERLQQRLGINAELHVWQSITCRLSMDVHTRTRPYPLCRRYRILKKIVAEVSYIFQAGLSLSLSCCETWGLVVLSIQFGYYQPIHWPICLFLFEISWWWLTFIYQNLSRFWWQWRKEKVCGGGTRFLILLLRFLSYQKPFPRERPRPTHHKEEVGNLGFSHLLPLDFFVCFTWDGREAKWYPPTSVFSTKKQKQDRKNLSVKSCSRSRRWIP